jgi:flagellar basal-body rod protein FlgB
MDNLFSIIDLAKVGLMAERAKVEVSSSNISNIHNPQFQGKEVNFEKLLTEMESAEKNTTDELQAQLTIDVNSIVDDKVSGEINLGQEVARMTDAELRYQTIAQTIQKKFGLMDLIIGGKNK